MSPEKLGKLRKLWFSERMSDVLLGIPAYSFYVDDFREILNALTTKSRTIKKLRGQLREAEKIIKDQHYVVYSGPCPGAGACTVAKWQESLEGK